MTIEDHRAPFLLHQTIHLVQHLVRVPPVVRYHRHRDLRARPDILMARLRDGEGTVGMLLKDDKIAKDAEALVADLKKNPWKLLAKR